jgi:hypothetical protein
MGCCILAALVIGLVLAVKARLFGAQQNGTRIATLAWRLRRTDHDGSP